MQFATTYNEVNFRSVITDFASWFLDQEAYAQKDRLQRIIFQELYAGEYSPEEKAAMLKHASYIDLSLHRSRTVREEILAVPPFIKTRLVSVCKTFSLLLKIADGDIDMKWADPRNFDQGAVWTLFFHTHFNMEDMEMDLRAFAFDRAHGLLNQSTRENLIPRLATYVANIPGDIE